MQARISRGPSVALGLEESGATPESVRAAFLGLTKKFHPARFGRMSNEIQRLSNEVFLGIKGAHEQLLRSLGAPARGSTMQTGGMPVLTAEGTNRTHLRPGTPPQRAPQPVTPARPAGPAIPRTLTPTKHGLGPPPTATTPYRPATPPQRPGTPPQTRPTTPQDRPSTQRIGVQPAASNDPPTTRGTGEWQPLQKTTPAFDERIELQQVLDALGQKNWGAAKALLNGLAARVPASKQYRALLAYTRGREAQTAGRGEDAVMEFQRALQLDPDLQQAKSAMGELLRRR
jgi:hypothetical protein